MPVAVASDPIHQWDVELPDCSADSVRVVYSNYRDEDDRVLGYIDIFREIQLHCTAPGGTAQVSGTRVLILHAKLESSACLRLV